MICHIEYVFINIKREERIIKDFSKRKISALIKARLFAEIYFI